MKLIVISSSEGKKKGPQTINEMFEEATSFEEAHFVIEMFRNGLPTFHLRKPKYSATEIEEYLKKIPLEFHNRIILHTHHYLATKYKVKGIHLSKNNKRTKIKTWIKDQLIKIKNNNVINTTSYSKIVAIIQEEEKNKKYDYVFLTPVFNNLTGSLIDGINENTIKSILKQANCKVIARGGVSVEKIEKIKELGFSGMAANSSLWKKNDPVQEFIKYVEKFKELNIAIE